MDYRVPQINRNTGHRINSRSSSRREAELTGGGALSAAVFLTAAETKSLMDQPVERERERPSLKDIGFFHALKTFIFWFRNHHSTFKASQLQFFLRIKKIKMSKRNKR